jgi:hypothetical protein
VCRSSYRPHSRTIGTSSPLPEIFGNFKITENGGTIYTRTCTLHMCEQGNGYGPDGFISTGLRSSKDGDEKATRVKWGKGGPDGWRRDAISKVPPNLGFGL